MFQFAPMDSLAFVDANDLAAVVTGIEQTNAWQALATPIGAPSKVSPNRWWIALARWTGLGSIDAVLLARSQVGVVFSGAEGSQAGNTLTIKPLTTFIIETHTYQRRMRAAVERHLEELARRIYKDPVFVRKTIESFEFEEWTSADGTHQIVFVFLDTAVIVGNDETSVLRSIRARLGNGPSLRDAAEFKDVRNRTQSSGAAVFGFISQSGIKSLLQAYALYRSDSSADAITGARIFADTFGALVKNAGWAASFRDGMVEDRFSVGLANGVANKLRTSAIPDRGPDVTNLQFVPVGARSVSLYQLHDSAGFWSELNAAVSSHADLIGAIAARPMLKSLLKSYGIDDPDVFSRAIGTRLQTIKVDENSPSVMVAESFDRQALRNLAMRRLGQNPKSEKLGEAELLLSSSDNWAAAFVNNYFLIGPLDMVRRCLLTQSSGSSLSTTEPFRKSQSHVDVSLPMIALTFATDERAAISFIETFAHQQRSAFATTGPEVDQATKRLPLALSATVLGESSIEWTARSSFGLGGSLAAQLFPQDYK
ncbi:MAG TPA: hypothetical protein VLN44_06045 [Pyrinomonadaceae bacterium]|nr:hypothetical protein [Pyrinomonadaceae bacterium]